jgi:hypothetical protein
MADETQDCPRYSVQIHAQGDDCGGTGKSTIGDTTGEKSVPITVAEGIALSSRVQGMLNRSQLKVRKNAIAKAEKWIRSRPPHGAWGQHTFPVAGTKNLRYDVDCRGTGNSFKS